MMTTPKNTTIRIILIISIIILLISFFSYSGTFIPKQSPTTTSYKDAIYTINGTPVQLVNGNSEVISAPGSESKIITRYFGNEVRKDLNSDGKEDVVFLLTQTTGGSGTFYYVVAALTTDTGYVGSQALLLGDRIAPQTTESGPNNSVIINYAERKPGDNFTVQPSVGKSLRLILDPKNMQFGEWVKDFEGESNR
jgi:hypothetical protein